jgi:hypothetical protein
LSYLGDAVRWPGLRLSIDVDGPAVTGWALEAAGPSGDPVRLMCCGTMSPLWNL